MIFRTFRWVAAHLGGRSASCLKLSAPWKRPRGGIYLWMAALGAWGLTGAALAGGIGNLVFRDANANRYYDPVGGDQPVAGVTLHLYVEGSVPGTDQPVAVQITDTNGHYLFSGQPDGNYFVFILPTAFTSGGALMNTRSVPGTYGAANSDDDAGENGIDSNLPTSQGVRSGLILLRAGQAPLSSGTETGANHESDDGADSDTDLTVDFGFEGFTTRVGDFVWHDLNRNGLQDPGEPGMANVPVQLFSGDENFISSTTTASDGFYTFTGLSTGSYYVQFPLSVFPMVLTTAELDPADLLDSDASVNTGRTPVFTISNLERRTQHDAGYVVDRPDIGNFVFDDRNEDGVQGVGENGIEGVPVELYAAGGGAPVAVTASDVSGFYQFASVEPGDYYLHFPATRSNGWVLSRADQSNDDLNDSDPDPVTGNTPVFTAEAGLDDQTRDAGYHSPPASIGGLAWHDVDKDGIRSPAEPVLPGVAVSLVDGNTNLVVATTVTGALGDYQFTGLVAQPWRVEFPALAGVDLRYQLTIQGAGPDRALDSDASVSDGRTVQVSPVDGERVVMDAGYRNVRLGLGNGVFKDSNKDGNFDLGEGVSGVKVQLFPASGDPLTDLPQAVTTTSSTGVYTFLDLLPGQYFVRIPPTEFAPGAPLSGWISLTGDGVDDGVDDNIGENGNDMPYPAGGGIRSNVVILSTGNEPVSTSGTENGRERTADDVDDSNIDLTVDFGFTTGMALGNLVYADASRNGGHNAGEGVAGATVQVYGSTALPGTDTPLGTVVTDASGFYRFIGLVPGNYRVHLPAANFQAGQPLAGHLSLPGHGTSATVDDPLDENGIDDTEPASNGISSPLFSLLAGTGPTAAQGENGAGSTADDTNETNGNLTVDFGFVPGLPVSYTAWQQQYLPAGANSPSQDADGDGLMNACEYLFHLPPSGGVAPQQPLTLLADGETGRIDARLVFNPIAADAAPVLTWRADLRDAAGAWQDMTQLTPVSTTLPDGRREYRWLDLESIPALATGAGFIRVRAGLDTNADSLPDLTFHTPVLGWRERLHQAGLATAGTGFLQPSLFTGTVDSAAGPALTLTTAAGGASLATLFPVGIPCYAEITAGPFQGHRFEIDEAATSGSVLRLLASSPLHTRAVPDLTGAPLAVRAHWTLAGLFPPDQFLATTNPATADQILTYPRPSFAAHWLVDLGSSLRWVRTDDVNLTDAGNRPVPPGEGLFVDRRSVALNVLDLGEVRPHRMARLLTAGYTLQTSGWPVPGSPSSWALRQSDGFTGSTNPAAADALQTWRADSAGGQQAFRSFFLLHASPPYQYWADKGDVNLRNQEDQLLFAPGRAVFMQLRSDVPASFEPCPWTP